MILYIVAVKYRETAIKYLKNVPQHFNSNVYIKDHILIYWDKEH